MEKPEKIAVNSGMILYESLKALNNGGDCWFHLAEGEQIKISSTFFFFLRNEDTYFGDKHYFLRN